VETLGRGGFLIHQEVDGLKEEYPHLVTYKRGDLNDLKEKIDYYIEHEDERKALVVKNYEWVRDNYTMDKKCAELLSKL
jgi:spore maturation protein CgeB